MVNGGRATAPQLEATLGRDQRSWSRVRQSLIEAGDLYNPRRGVLEITVPALGRYALHHYPDLAARAAVSDHLVTLDTMRTRTQGTPPAPPNSPPVPGTGVRAPVEVQAASVDQTATADRPSRPTKSGGNLPAP